MKEKRREKIPLLVCEYASAGGKMPRQYKQLRLENVSDIRAKISDGTLAAWLDEFDSSARKQLGGDCELISVTARQEDCFYLSDYEPGEEIPIPRVPGS